MMIVVTVVLIIVSVCIGRVNGVYYSYKLRSWLPFDFIISTFLIDDHINRGFSYQTAFFVVDEY